MKRTTQAAAALLCLSLAAGCDPDGEPDERQNEQEQADTAVHTTPLDSAVQGIDVDTSGPLDANTTLPDSPALGQDSVLLRQ